MEATAGQTVEVEERTELKSTVEVEVEMHEALIRMHTQGKTEEDENGSVSDKLKVEPESEPETEVKEAEVAKQPVVESKFHIKKEQVQFEALLPAPISTTTHSASYLTISFSFSESGEVKLNWNWQSYAQAVGIYSETQSE